MKTTILAVTAALTLAFAGAYAADKLITAGPPGIGKWEIDIANIRTCAAQPEPKIADAKIPRVGQPPDVFNANLELWQQYLALSSQWFDCNRMVQVYEQGVRDGKAAK